MRADLAPTHLLIAYANGIFPMADEGDEIVWFAPDPRAILELNAFKASRSLRAVVRQGKFHITINRAFDDVLEQCADRGDGTWISPEIQQAYSTLHRLGFAHSVETWQGESLAGGLYGVTLGGAFFGESMFHCVTDASKVALFHLVERLRERRFVLLDVQFVTAHLQRFGVSEITRQDYEKRLRIALSHRCHFVDRTPTIQRLPNQDEE